MKQPLPNNNNNFMQQKLIIDTNIDVNDPMQAMQTVFALMYNAFKKHYSTPTNNNQRISSNTYNKKVSQPWMNMNQGRQMCMVTANARNQGNRQRHNVGNQIVAYNAGWNGNQTVGNPHGNVAAPVVGNYGNGQNNFELPKSTQGTYVEKQYDSNIMAETPNVDLSGGDVERHVVNNKETNADFESLLNNFKVELDKGTMVNCEAKAVNERLTAELAKYKGQQTFFKYNEHKYNELEIGYRNFVYEEQCLTQKQDDLTRSSEKMIKSLNIEISNLKNQLSNQETYSTLEKERDELKFKFSKCKDELLEEIIEIYSSLEHRQANKRPSRSKELPHHDYLDQIKSNDRAESSHKYVTKDNTKQDRVSYAPKRSFPKNKLSECNESVCVTCKKCMFYNVHDACVSKFVNDMNSHANAQHVKVSNIEYKKKLKAKAKNTEKYYKERCLSDDTLVIPLEEIQLDDKLNFVEEPVEIMDREVKQLKRSRIPIVKVRWNAQRGPEYTWEREDQFKSKYPHLFAKLQSPTTS
ncbi:hypothetical protein Tco_0896666 [Tanacetum coccineum]